MKKKNMLHLMDSLPPKDIMVEVKKFLSSTSKSPQNLNTIELTRTALRLLNNVPATREAVLEHFCSVFFAAVSKHVRQLEARQNLPIEENVITEIHLVLSSFISQNSDAWAPIISTWSLKLLGELSSNYSQRLNPSRNLEINDSLQKWLSCKAARTLIEIAVQCLQSLMHTNAESCIKDLLDISEQHSPYFDWVVAHVGSCFPNFVITRVLSCGLKDFCINKYHDQRNRQITSKLNSVVAILSHLAGSHFQHINEALIDLFKWSLNENDIINEETKIQKLATVPFLLSLASLSPMLLNALTSDISQILKPDLIPKLALVSSHWMKYFNNSATDLINVTVGLVLKCNRGAFQIINILLETILNSSNSDNYNSVSRNLKNICQEILELILDEIEFKIRTDGPNANQIPLLFSIEQEISNVIPLLLKPHPLMVKTALRLLCLLGSQNSNVLILAATYILQKAQTPLQLAVIIRLITDSTHIFSRKYKNSSREYEFLIHVVEQAIRELQYKRSSEQDIHQLFENLSLLLKWEISGKVPSLKSNLVIRALKANLLQMSTYFAETNNFYIASNFADIFNSLSSLKSSNFSINVELTLKLTRAIIRFFFFCIAKEDVIKKIRGVKKVCQFLKVLTSYSQYTRVLALREILEIVIVGNSAKYFGAKEEFMLKLPESLLLQQNHKQGTGAILAQRHSSVFHAGIIGQGPRQMTPNTNENKDIISLNNTLLLDVLKSCCSSRHLSNSVDTDALNLVSLLLVELISPDVMYNGLPWPDEDFTRVTVERDLQIQRSFKDTPVLWTLLQLTAWYRPSLAYCSVLLRAIVATVLSNWDVNKGLQITNVMALGQLLPFPLSTIIEILPVLKPHQITTVLRECIWIYMQENVPSPMLFTRAEGTNIAWRDSDNSVPHPRFTETLRRSLLANISVLSPLYATLFFNENKQ